MSAATILFMDLVGFSKKPTSEQRRLVEDLNNETAKEIGPLLKSDDLLAMPTGDGMALAFLLGNDKKRDIKIIFKLIFGLNRWAALLSKDGSEVSLRMGVHFGPVEIVTDINGNDNVCGDTINHCQRVMDAANPRQTLFSDAAFRHYIGSESKEWVEPPFSKDLRATFPHLSEVYAKHDRQILVRALVLSPTQEWLDDEDLLTSKLMVVRSTPLPKEIIGSFSEKLKKARQVAFVQLTGDRFLDSWRNGNINFSEELERFWVFMPEPKAYGQLNLPKQYPGTAFLENCVDKWKEFFAAIRERYKAADLKLGLFTEPPYFGGSFLDWEWQRGKIHISPYIWNVAANECPGYDLEWIGSKPPAVYNRYIQGLNYLQSQTSNELSVRGKQ